MNNRLIAGVVAAACALTAPVGVLHAQDGMGGMGASADADLPSAEKVFAKYVEATGGEKAYRDRTGMIVKGKFAVPAAGMTGDLSIWQSAPNKMFMEIEMAGMGAMTRGTDGETAWENSMMGGPRILEGAEAKQMIIEGDLMSDLHPEKLYDEMETIGSETVDGKRCYVVRTVSGDNETKRFFDAESGLLVMLKASQESQYGVVEVATTMSDYKDVDGLKVPHKTTVSAMGMEQIITFDSVEMNPEIPAEKFDLPAEIKELKGE